MLDNIDQCLFCCVLNQDQCWVTLLKSNLLYFKITAIKKVTCYVTTLSTVQNNSLYVCFTKHKNPFAILFQLCFELRLLSSFVV